MLQSVRNKLHGVVVLYEKAPWVVLGIAIGLSLTLFIIGKILEPPPSHLQQLPALTKLAILVGNVAQVCLVGGIVAAITRMFAASGFFRAALSDINDKHFEAFEAKVRQIVDLAVLRREEEDGGNLEELWQRVSQKFLLPGFTIREEADQSFVNSVNAALRKMIDERANYYIADTERTIILRRFDAKSGSIEIEDRASFSVVPFNASEPVTLKMRFIAASGNRIENYGVNTKLFQVDGEDRVPTMKPDPTTLTSDLVVPVVLSGRPRYSVERVTSVRQPIDTDPYFMFSPDYVCSGLRVTIRTQVSKKVSAIFEEVGVEGAFRKQFARADHRTENTDEDPMEEVYACDQTLLPTQGFVVIMTRKQETGAASAEKRQ